MSPAPQCGAIVFSSQRTLKGRTVKNPQFADIPSHEVVMSSPRGGEDFYSIEDPAAWGDNDTCLDYIRTHRPARGCKFAIRYIDSGRLASFSIEHTHGWKV